MPSWLIVTCYVGSSFLYYIWIIHLIKDFGHRQLEQILWMWWGEWRKGFYRTWYHLGGKWRQFRGWLLTSRYLYLPTCSTHLLIKWQNSDFSFYGNVTTKAGLLRVKKSVREWVQSHLNFSSWRWPRNCSLELLIIWEIHQGELESAWEIKNRLKYNVEMF